MVDDRKARQKLARQKYYLKNREYFIQKTRDQKARRIAWWKRLKSCMRCQVCPETFPPCIDLHHKDPATKTDVVARMGASGSCSKSVILKEISKCIAICSNCHRKIHHGFFCLAPHLPSATILIDPSLLEFDPLYK